MLIQEKVFVTCYSRKKKYYSMEINNEENIHIHHVINVYDSEYR
jgi:hypothetical protein